MSTHSNSFANLNINYKFKCILFFSLEEAILEDILVDIAKEYYGICNTIVSEIVDDELKEHG